MRDDAHDPLPRYQQVANELATAIRDGRHPVGSLLPTESELCDRFSVSRYTVREALRRLAELGLVSRRQGAGTQVEAAEPAASYSHSMRSVAELFQYASETRLRLDTVGRVTADGDLAFLLGARPGRAWLRLSGIRLDREGRPICRTVVFVHPDYADIEPDLGAHPGPIYQLIEARCGVTVREVRQEITAEPMADEVAAALGRPVGSWAVRVTRRYVGDGDKPIEVSLNHHPAEGFRYAMLLRRDEPGEGSR